MNEIKNTINDCSKTNWIMRQIWKMNLIKKWKRQKNINANKNSYYRINQKKYLINFVFIFVFVFIWTFDALFLSDYNRQMIHKRFYFIFIFNRCNDVNFILYSDFLLFRLFYNFNRNVNFFFKRFIFDFNTFYFENIKQFFIFDFNEIKLSFRCFYSFLKLNQKILKLLYFRVNNVRMMMCDIINRNNYIINATLLFDIFAHASDIMNIFYQRV